MPRKTKAQKTKTKEEKTIKPNQKTPKFPTLKTACLNGTDKLKCRAIGQKKEKEKKG